VNILDENLKKSTISVKIRKNSDKIAQNFSSLVKVKYIFPIFL